MIRPRILSVHAPNFLQRVLLQFGVFCLLIVLAACGPSSPAPDETPSLENEEVVEPSSTAPVDVLELPATEPATSEPDISYPPPEVPLPTEIEGAYPPQLPMTTKTPEVYPPVTEEVFLEPRIIIDKPLKAGATLVTGQAPPNMALAIVNVTFNGEFIGSGVSTADNTFSIGVNELQEGHLIGVTFAELEPGLDIAGMSRKYFPHRGEGFLNLPNVGIMLDTAQVEP